MRIFYLIIFCIISCVTVSAQVKRKATKPKKYIVTPLLKTKSDSISYAAGMNQVKQMKGMHMGFNINAIDQGIADSLKHKKPLLSAVQREILGRNFDKRTVKDSTVITGPVMTITFTAGLMTNADSVSYSYGLDIANSLQNDYGVKTLNYILFNQAVADGLVNKPAPFSTLQSRKILSTIYRPEYLKNLAASDKFMAGNKGNPGVITLPDGLQYMILKPGTGANVMMGDSVSAHYKGTLINGKQFDSSYDRGEPLKLTDITRVITGWTEGLQLMNLGAKYRFFIPPNLAYGSRQRSDIIAPYSALIFDVEVVKINDRSL